MRPEPVTESFIDPIPRAVREFLDAYEELLPDVRFPDVDQTYLAALVSDVADHAADVERAEQRLAAAREALEQAQAILLQNARRALAYARVYADGDDEVCETLAALALADGDVPDVDRPSRGRRGKPRTGGNRAGARTRRSSPRGRRASGPAVTDAA